MTDVKREGAIKTYTHHNKRAGAMVYVRTDTDFVARNEEFLQFVDGVLMSLVFERNDGNLRHAGFSEMLESAWIAEGDFLNVGEAVAFQKNKFKENISIEAFQVWSLDA